MNRMLPLIGFVLLAGLFGPGAIVLLGAAGLLFTVRKRARSAPAAPPPVDDEDW